MCSCEIMKAINCELISLDGSRRDGFETQASYGCTSRRDGMTRISWEMFGALL